MSYVLEYFLSFPMSNLKFLYFCLLIQAYHSCFLSTGMEVLKVLKINENFDNDILNIIENILDL